MLKARLRYIQDDAKKLATLLRNYKASSARGRSKKRTIAISRTPCKKPGSTKRSILPRFLTSPPCRNPRLLSQVLAKRNKVVLELAAGGAGLGLALAFLLELVLNRTIKRPAELEKRLQAPVLVSIPHHGLNGKSRFRLNGRKKDKTLAVAGAEPPPNDPPPWI